MLDPRRVIASPEVAAALSAGRPVVALESTIIAHGFPFPDNLTLARAAERAVRDEGAVPATIAVIDGVARVGLDEAGLEALANGTFVKCASRDLPVVLARGQSAATTVSATCLVSAFAGIEVFATGGIGGVHRGAAESFDESADLHALSRWPVLVVSAGAKAILDLEKTVERLESFAVPVVGLGCGVMPSFYSRTSAAPVSCTAADVAEVAAIWRQRRGQAGMLVANPIPARAEIPAEIVQSWIAESLQEARESGVFGKDLTPFLLADLARRSEGRTVAANRALALHNATVAAAIAREICATPAPGAP